MYEVLKGPIHLIGGKDPEVLRKGDRTNSFTDDQAEQLIRANVIRRVSEAEAAESKPAAKAGKAGKKADKPAPADGTPPAGEDFG